jgi:hypothetical protein
MKSNWHNKLGTCIWRRVNVFILKIKVNIVCNGAKLQQWINLKIETMLDYYLIYFHKKFQPHRTFSWRDIIARSKGVCYHFFPNVVKLTFDFWTIFLDYLNKNIWDFFWMLPLRLTFQRIYLC